MRSGGYRNPNPKKNIDKSKSTSVSNSGSGFVGGMMMYHILFRHRNNNSNTIIQHKKSIPNEMNKFLECLKNNKNNISNC